MESNASTVYRQISAADRARQINGNIYGDVHLYADNEGPNISADPRDACLRSLGFSEMDMRKADIALAHRNTCDWLFETPEFRMWLDDGVCRSYNGVIWIKGSQAPVIDLSSVFASSMADTLLVREVDAYETHTYTPSTYSTGLHHRILFLQRTGQ
jgi:hypothetical protein